jgi:hypothetical protein
VAAWRSLTPSASAGWTESTRTSSVWGRPDTRESEAAGRAGKKGVRLAVKRQAAAYLEQTDRVSERRAGCVLALHRRTQRRPAGQRDQGELVPRMPPLAAPYRRFG